MSLETSIHVPSADIQGAWRLRFWSIWLGQAFSLIGSALTQFVLIWWITQTTKSASALAIAGMMGLLPHALLSALGGTIADRYNRRMVMLIADSISAVCMLILIWLFRSNQIQLWHIYTMMFIRSSMQAFQSPASSASTAMLVPRDWISRVAGLNQMLMGITTIGAAPLGALLLGFLPFYAALSIDIATAVLGIVPLLLFSIPQPARHDHQHSSMWSDFKAGARVVIHNRGLLMLYGLLTLVVLTIMPTFSLTPLLVTEHFAGTVNHVAIMEGLAGMGMIAGGVLITMMPIRRKIVTVLISFAFACAAVAATALMPTAAFGWAVVFWTLSGITYATGNAPMMAIIQTQVPNAVQGRVLSLLNMLMGIATPVGLAIAAILGETMGVRAVFIIGGLSSAFICLLGFLSPSLMKIEEREIKFMLDNASISAEDVDSK